MGSHFVLTRPRCWPCCRDPWFVVFAKKKEAKKKTRRSCRYHFVIPLTRNTSYSSCVFALRAHTAAFGLHPHAGMFGCPSHASRFACHQKTGGQELLRSRVSAIPGLLAHYTWGWAGLMHRPAGRPTLVGPGLHVPDPAPTACNCPHNAYIHVKGHLRPFLAIYGVPHVFC